MTLLIPDGPQGDEDIKKGWAFTHPFVQIISFYKLILRPELPELRAQPSFRPSLLLCLSSLSLPS